MNGDAMRHFLVVLVGHFLKLMQAKDIPELPILEFLSQLGCWGSMFSPEITETSVFRAMPEETPAKVARAKMASLIKRGLVDGCTCGCRGDFELTDKGCEFLRAHKTT